MKEGGGGGVGAGGGGGGGGGWGGGQAKFEKARVSNIGGLYKIEELAATC